jgi:hypothetical protein
MNKEGSKLTMSVDREGLREKISRVLEGTNIGGTNMCWATRSRDQSYPYLLRQ